MRYRSWLAIANIMRAQKKKIALFWLTVHCNVLVSCFCTKYKWKEAKTEQRKSASFRLPFCCCCCSLPTIRYCICVFVCIVNILSVDVDADFNSSSTRINFFVENIMCSSYALFNTLRSTFSSLFEWIFFVRLFSGLTSLALLLFSCAFEVFVFQFKSVASYRRRRRFIDGEQNETVNCGVRWRRRWRPNGAIFVCIEYNFRLFYARMLISIPKDFTFGYWFRSEFE